MNDGKRIDLPIGFGNYLSADKTVAVLSPDSAPIKRLIQEARDRGMLIDASYGRKTKAVLLMDQAAKDPS